MGGFFFPPLQPLHKSLDTTNMEQLITPLTTLGHLAQLAPEQFAAPLKSLVANFIVKDLLMNDRVHSSDMQRQGFYWLLSHILPNSTALNSLKFESNWLCVWLDMWMTVLSMLGDRCQVRRQPSCGFLMMRCLQKLWPRSEPHRNISHVWPLITCLVSLPTSVCICCITAEIELGWIREGVWNFYF